MQEYKEEEIKDEFVASDVRKILWREEYVEKNKLSMIDNKDRFYHKLRNFRNKTLESDSFGGATMNFLAEDVNKFMEMRFKKILSIAFRYYDNDKLIAEERLKMTSEEEKFLNELVASIKAFKAILYDR